MEIVQAKAFDLKAVFKLLKDAAAHMRKQGIFQWNENYPQLSHVKADLRAKNLFLLKNDSLILGAVSIDDQQSPEYTAINWQYENGKIMVVHRLAISPSHQKKGYGKLLMDFARDYAIENKAASIRLDAYSQNARTLQFYKSRGYVYRGDIFFPYRDEPFHCFEKRLEVYD